MAFSSISDDCRRPGSIPARSGEPVFRRLPGYLRMSKAIFPQILSRCYRIAGTYCRHRWFARYARSESLLCAAMADDLRPTPCFDEAVALRG